MMIPSRKLMRISQDEFEKKLGEIFALYAANFLLNHVFLVLGPPYSEGGEAFAFVLSDIKTPLGATAVGVMEARTDGSFHISTRFFDWKDHGEVEKLFKEIDSAFWNIDTEKQFFQKMNSLDKEVGFFKFSVR